MLVADFPSRWRDENAFCHGEAIKGFPINIAQNISRSARNHGGLKSPAQFSLYSTATNYLWKFLRANGFFYNTPSLPLAINSATSQTVAPFTRKKTAFMRSRRYLQGTIRAPPAREGVPDPNKELGKRRLIPLSAQERAAPALIFAHVTKEAFLRLFLREVRGR